MAGKRLVATVRLRCWYCGKLSRPVKLSGHFLACGTCGRAYFYRGNERGRDDSVASSAPLPGPGLERRPGEPRGETP